MWPDYDQVGSMEVAFVLAGFSQSTSHWVPPVLLPLAQSLYLTRQAPIKQRSNKV
jgi:hypothetical protein